MTYEGEFTRPNVTYSSCFDCSIKETCNKIPASKDKTMVLSRAFRLIISGGLQNSELILGFCETGRELVIHDKGYAPEFTEGDRTGIHEMRISDGLTALTVNVDATWNAPIAPFELTHAIAEMKDRNN